MPEVANLSSVYVNTEAPEEEADIETAASDAEILKKSIEHTAMIKTVFGTQAGKKYLEYLRHTFVERSIARSGDGLLEIGIRQGEADIVRKIIAEIEREI